MGISIGSAPALASGLSYEIDIDTPGQILLNVVPETGTGALVALGLALMARRSLRKA